MLLKTEMNAGHGGKSGSRDGAIEEIAIRLCFCIKNFKKDLKSSES